MIITAWYLFGDKTVIAFDKEGGRRGVGGGDDVALVAKRDVVGAVGNLHFYWSNIL